MYGLNEGFVYKISKPFLQVKRFRERFTYLVVKSPTLYVVFKVVFELSKCTNMTLQTITLF
jgi:hypothetical protein